MTRPGITDEARCAEESTVWLAVSTQVVCLENVMDDFCRECSNRSHEGGRGRTQCSSLYLYHQTQLKQTSVVNPNQTGRAVIFLDSDTVHSPAPSDIHLLNAARHNSRYTTSAWTKFYHFASLSYAAYHAINVESMFLSKRSNTISDLSV